MKNWKIGWILEEQKNIELVFYKFLKKITKNVAKQTILLVKKGAHQNIQNLLIQFMSYHRWKILNYLLTVFLNREKMILSKELKQFSMQQKLHANVSIFIDRSLSYLKISKSFWLLRIGACSCKRSFEWRNNQNKCSKSKSTILNIKFE